MLRLVLERHSDVFCFLILRASTVLSIDGAFNEVRFDEEVDVDVDG